MKKDNQIYLGHILECIDSILTYTDGMNFQNFSENKMVIDAVCRNIEIIGEATKNLDEEFKSNHPTIPWKNMAGMRDKMIHDYIGVDIEVVWAVVEVHLPKLKNSIEMLL